MAKKGRRRTKKLVEKKSKIRLKKEKIPEKPIKKKVEAPNRLSEILAGR